MNSLALLIGMKISIAIMENNMEAPQQKRNGIHNIQLSHLLDIYAKEMKSAYQRDIYIQMFIVALSQ